MNHLEIINECNHIETMKIKLENLSKNNYQEEAVMYILVNTDLKMEKGKVAGQCSHSVSRVTRLVEENWKNDAYTKWIHNFEPKIVLKSSEKEMLEIIEKYELIKIDDIKQKDIWCIYTRDIGRTQIDVGQLTTLAFCPILRKDVPDYIKKLKLF